MSLTHIFVRFFHQVVFSTGLKPLGNDEFYVIYGGADTDVGLTRIKVDVNALG